MALGWVGMLVVADMIEYRVYSTGSVLPVMMQQVSVDDDEYLPDEPVLDVVWVVTYPATPHCFVFCAGGEVGPAQPHPFCHLSA